MSVVYDAGVLVAATRVGSAVLTSDPEHLRRLSSELASPIRVQRI